MTADKETRALLTCALLHLDPRIVDKRLALNGLLVEVGLYARDDPCTAEELQDSIDRMVGQRQFLIEEDLQSAIQDCLVRQTVTALDDRYVLAQNARGLIDDAFQDADSTRHRVKVELVEQIEVEIGEAIHPALSSEIFDFIERVLASEVYERSIQLARENLSLEDMLVTIDSVDPLQDLDPILDRHFPPERGLVRDQIRFGIRSYFRSLNPDLQSFLTVVHYTVLINQILNLDPSMVEAQRRWFENRRLYLDTNVVLAYLFEGQLLHPIVEEVLSATTNLGAQLLVSPATLDELGGQIERAKQNSARLQSDPLVQQIAAHGDDAVLATYVNAKRGQPALDWSSFIAQFEDLPSTLFDYGILLENEGFKEGQALEEFEAIKKTIAEVKRNHSSESVIKHDAVNCALVVYLRNTYKPDERGHQVWLLTIDRSLGTVQRILIGASILEGPYCMQAQTWGEIALPAQSVLDFVFKDFIGYLAQAKLGALADPQIVQLDFLETIRDAEVDVDRLLKLHPDNVRAVICTLQVDREARQSLRDATSAPNAKEKATYQRQFDLRLDEAVKETDPVEQLKQDFDKRFVLLNSKVESRDQTIATLQERLRDAESNFGYRIARWFGDRIPKRR